MSGRRPIAAYTLAEYDALRKRLEEGRDALRTSGSLIQSVARAYYVTYVVASYAAGKQGVEVTHWRDRELKTEQNFSHNEFVDVVWALYAGVKRGNVSNPGRSPGITSARYSDRDAAYYANKLYYVRIEADYGPSMAVEPYAAAEIDELLTTAHYLVRDLERLI